jgi:hypothetical protein
VYNKAVAQVFALWFDARSVMLLLVQLLYLPHVIGPIAQTLALDRCGVLTSWE